MAASVVMVKTPTSPTGNNPFRRQAVRYQGGFTLIETLVVIMLLAVVTAALSPSLIPTPNTQLRANASELVSALRDTRLHAMRSRRQADLGIDTASNTYQLPQKAIPVFLDGDFEMRLTTAQEQLVGTTGSIRFMPDGSSTGGRITLSNGSLLRHIDVEWLTGRIRIHEVDQ